MKRQFNSQHASENEKAIETFAGLHKIAFFRNLYKQISAQTLVSVSSSDLGKYLNASNTQKESVKKTASQSKSNSSGQKKKTGKQQPVAHVPAPATSETLRQTPPSVESQSVEKKEQSPLQQSGKTQPAAQKKNASVSNKQQNKKKKNKKRSKKQANSNKESSANLEQNLLSSVALQEIKEVL